MVTVRLMRGPTQWAAALCFLMFLSGAVSGQPFPKLWDRAFGASFSPMPNHNQMNASLALPDGGFLIGGSSASPSTLKDFWAFRTDSLGNVLWEKYYGGNDLDSLIALAHGPDGGFYLFGISHSGISGDKTQAPRGTDHRGAGDYWVVRVDANGNKIWDRTFGSSGYDVPTCAVAYPDGGVILGGEAWSPVSGDKSEGSFGLTDTWLVRVAPDGSKIWDNTLGAGFDDAVRDLKIAPDGGVVMFAVTSSFAGNDKTENPVGGFANFDFWLVKLNKDGVKLWDKTIGGTDGEGAIFLELTPDGGYLLGGASKSGVSGHKTTPNRGLNDYWLVKLDASRNVQWDRNFGGTGEDVPYKMIKAPGSGYLLLGVSASPLSWDKSQSSRGGSDFWMLRLDANGNKLWDRTFGGSGSEMSGLLALTAGGNIWLGGHSGSPASGDKPLGLYGLSDIWMFKADGNGQKMAGTDKAYFGYEPSGDLPNKLTVGQGMVLLGGGSLGRPYESHLGLRPGMYVSSDKSQPGRGGGDYWILATDQVGNRLWDRTLGGTGTDVLLEAMSTRDGNFLVGGWSDSPASTDKAQGSRGLSDMWAVKLSPNGAVVWERTFGGNSGDGIWAMANTPDGGYLLAGKSVSGISGEKTSANKGEADIWMVKVSASGTKVWDKTYGGTLNDEIEHILPLPDGNFLLCGSSYSAVGGDKTAPAYGRSDFWILKVDPNGNKIWDKSYGGTGDDFLIDGIALGGDIYLLGSSNSVASGVKSSPNFGSDDYWLVKVDNNGNKIWDRSLGGTGSDRAVDLEYLPDGRLALLGGSESPVSGNRSAPLKGNSDAWVAVVGQNGNLIFETSYGGTGYDRPVSFGLMDRKLLIGFGSNSPQGIDRSAPTKGGYDYWLLGASVGPALTLWADSAWVPVGREVLLPVRVKGFDGIVSAQGTWTLADTSVAEFVGAEGWSFPNTTAQSFNIGPREASFVLSSAVGVTLADSSVLFNLRVRSKGPATRHDRHSPVYPANNVPWELADSTLLPVAFDTLVGKVLVPGMALVRGRLATPNGQPVSRANLWVLDSLSGGFLNWLFVDNDGRYSFETPKGNTVRLSVAGKYNDLRPRSGVTALDLAFMRRHILGLDTLPVFGQVASDLNGDLSVKATDLAWGERFILGLEDYFPPYRLWHFLPDGQSYKSPFDGRFDSVAFVLPLADTVEQGFTGVKLGDVNGTWDPSAARVTAGELLVKAGGASVAPGGRVRVPFRAEGFTEVPAMQFTLWWDPAQLEAVAVHGGALSMRHNLGLKEQGVLPVLWYDTSGGTVTLPDTAVLFELEFIAKGAMGGGSSVGVLPNGPVEALAYTSDGQPVEITAANGRVDILADVTGLEEGTLSARLRAWPNPAAGELRVSVDGTRLESVSLLDLTGRTVRSWRASGGEAVLGLGGIPAGTYLLLATTPEGTAAKRIVVE